MGRVIRSELAGLIGSGRIFDLAQPLRGGMPQRAGHPKFQLSLARRHGDVVRPSGLSTANELVVLSGHSGTHLDALSHASVRGRLHGRASAREAEGHEGMRKLGVETVPAFARRFILFDLATETGGPPLPPATSITGMHLATLAGKAGLTPRRGDIALVRTGWGALWDDPARYDGRDEGIAGIDMSAAEWLAEHDVAAIGADNMTVEFEPRDANDLPIHAFCLVERGIYLIENLNLEGLGAANAREGLFVGAPLRIVGATGAPIRPIAIA